MGELFRATPVGLLWLHVLPGNLPGQPPDYWRGARHPQRQGIEPDPIFVTIDPQRDTPELLKEYLSAFREGFLGLSGEDDQIRKLSEVFKAYYERSDLSEDTEYYLMDHTSYIYLVAPDGTVLEYYPESTEPQN